MSSSEGCFIEHDEVFQILEEYDKQPDTPKHIQEQLGKLLRRRTLQESSHINLLSEEKAHEIEIRRRASEQLKLAGNECFRREDYGQALEHYSLAISQFDKNPILYTNRAQTQIQLKNWQAAVEDCERARRLDPKLIKAQIHQAKAYRGMKDFQKALDVLEEAEDLTQDEQIITLIHTHRKNIIADMKSFMLKG